MNKFVQDPGIKTAYHEFEKKDVVRFIIHPNNDVGSVGSEIWKRLKVFNQGHKVSLSEYFVLAEMDKQEFDAIMIPLIESKTIKHVHIDRLADY